MARTAKISNPIRSAFDANDHALSAREARIIADLNSAAAMRCSDAIARERFLAAAAAAFDGASRLNRHRRCGSGLAAYDLEAAQ